MKDYKNSQYVVAADIGGSHITAAIVDLTHRKVLEDTRKRYRVDCHGSKAEILEGWSYIINQVMEESDSPVRRLGIAMPGPFDYLNGISYITGLHKYESLYGVNVKSYFSRSLGLDPLNIVFRNDAEAFLHGEVVGGAGAGYDHVVGFTLGTGMGSATSFSGVTIDANWGSVPYKESIADDYFSTRWFIKAYRELTGKHCTDVKELAQLATDNDDASSVFQHFAEQFGQFIRSRIREKSPDVIVIGGNISKCHPLFLSGLQLSIAPLASEIRIAELGEDAPLVGVAATFQNAEITNDVNP